MSNKNLIVQNDNIICILNYLKKHFFILNKNFISFIYH